MLRSFFMKNLLATLAAAAILTSGVAFAQAAAPAPVASGAPHAAHHVAKKGHHHHHHHHARKGHGTVAHAHKSHPMKKGATLTPSAAPSSM
jgi:Ni/Co efflux regulator RcnB